MEDYKTLDELEMNLLGPDDEIEYIDEDSEYQQRITDFFINWRFGYTTKDDEKKIYEYNELQKSYDAYYYKGMFYALGIHVVSDMDKAREYFTMAVSKKDYLAVMPLAMMAEIYTKEPNYRKIYHLYTSSPRYTDDIGFCYFMIGRMRLYGLGCTKDKALAKRYLTRAYKALFCPARHLYDLVYSEPLHPELQSMEDAGVIPNNTAHHKTIAALAAMLSQRFDLSVDRSMIPFLEEARAAGYLPAMNVLENLHKPEFLKDQTFRMFLLDLLLEV